MIKSAKNLVNAVIAGNRDEAEKAMERIRVLGQAHPEDLQGIALKLLKMEFVGDSLLLRRQTLRSLIDAGLRFDSPVSALVRGKFDVDSDMESTLSTAIRNSTLAREDIHLLLAAGANVNETANDGSTPSTLVFRANRFDMIGLFSRAGMEDNTAKPLAIEYMQGMIARMENEDFEYEMADGKKVPIETFFGEKILPVMLQSGIDLDAVDREGRDMKALLLVAADRNRRENNLAVSAALDKLSTALAEGRERLRQANISPLLSINTYAQIAPSVQTVSWMKRPDTHIVPESLEKTSFLSLFNTTQSLTTTNMALHKRLQGDIHEVLQCGKPESIVKYLGALKEDWEHYQDVENGSKKSSFLMSLSDPALIYSDFNAPVKGSEQGDTPVMVAIRNGDISVLRALLDLPPEFQPDLNRQNLIGESAASLAAKTGSIEMMRLLVGVPGPDGRPIVAPEASDNQKKAGNLASRDMLTLTSDHGGQEQLTEVAARHLGNHGNLQFLAQMERELGFGKILREMPDLSADELAAEVTEIDSQARIGAPESFDRGAFPDADLEINYTDGESQVADRGEKLADWLDAQQNFAGRNETTPVELTRINAEIKHALETANPRILAAAMQHAIGMTNKPGTPMPKTFETLFRRVEHGVNKEISGTESSRGTFHVRKEEFLHAFLPSGEDRGGPSKIQNMVAYGITSDNSEIVRASGVLMEANERVLQDVRNRIEPQFDPVVAFGSGGGAGTQPSGHRT